MFQRTRRQDDFAAEVESHLQIESERLQADGLSAGDARAAACRAFGNVTAARERFYESQRWLWRDHVCRDFQYGARMLRKSPGFTVVAVLTMALGVGATTAIFSVVDATLLHPLPYPHPEQLVWIEDDLPGVPAHDVGMSQAEMLDLERSGIFQFVSPAWFDQNNLTGAPQPARVNLDSVAPSCFALLGVMPRIGRAFDPKDHSPGYLGEVVISDGLWKRLFGSDPSVLKKSIRLDTDLYRIIGVMPGGFRAPGRTPQERNVEVWAATSFYGPPLPDHPPRSGRNIPGAIGRLQPGLTIEAAQSKVDNLVTALHREYANDYPPQSACAVRLRPLNERVVGDLRRTLVLLFGAVGLVRLIGCVNIANLLLARASARGRELAIRRALAAAKRRLVQQLLTESLLLTVVGGTAGVMFLLAAKQLLLSLVPESLPRLNDISISWSVLLFALGASVASGVILGLVPALQVNRLGPAERLKQERRTSTTSSTQARTRRILAVTQFALSLALLDAAGLLLRSSRI
jgi:putative ABC transport system permease protein